MVGQVYTLGETVLDIIFKNRVASSSTPGGSSFNAAISLGRLGVPVAMLTEFGEDLAGKLILDFMEKNGVSTNYVQLLQCMKTPIALAFLDKNQDAEYQFYKDPVPGNNDALLPDFEPGDYLLYGSFYVLNPMNRPRVKAIQEKAREAGATLVYDPNFRKNHLADPAAMAMLRENMAYADLLRASNEDMEYLFGARNAEEAMEAVVPYCRNLVYTCGAKGVDLRAGDQAFHMDTTRIKPVSTIGAGDTFNAGLVYGLWKSAVTRTELDHMPEAQWKEVLQRCINFSSQVCMSMENYLPSGGL